VRVHVPLNLTVGVSLLVGGLALACSSSDSGGGGGPNPNLVLAKTAANSGDAQTATVGQALALPVRVILTNNGAAEQGTTVNWATASGTIDATSITDVDGVATATWTLGNTSGPVTATATVTDATGSPITFTATADPDAPAELSIAGGDGQQGTVNATLPPLQAKVADQFGNGVPGVAVTWTVTSGDGTVAPGTSNTDANGIAETELTFGATAGDVTVDAEVTGLTGSPQTFTETSIAVPTTVTITVANNTFTPKTSDLAAGGTVTWTWGAGAVGHSVISDGPETFTSHTPLESAPFTYGPVMEFNTAGTYNFHCSAHGNASGGGMAGTITVH
jgi:plastocyanin